MCSRFFIDFPTSDVQYTKIIRCIESRFLQRGDVQGSLSFLDVLYRTVSCQARCLMESQRYETISHIMRIRDGILYSYYYYRLPPPYIPISGFSGPNVTSTAVSTASYHHHNTMSSDYHYQHHRHGNAAESSRTSPPPPHYYRNSRSRKTFHHRNSGNAPRSRSISPQNEPWNSQSLPTAQQAEVRS